MRSSLAIALPALLVLLAGCSDVPSDDGTGAPLATPTTSTSADALAPEAPAIPVSKHLDWNGSLVAGVWACDSVATHDCVIQPDGSFGAQQAFDGLAGNLTTGEAVLAWTPATPLTQELVLEGIIRTPDCGDCEATFIPAMKGTSPLTLPLAGQGLLPGQQLLLVVYSGQYLAGGGLAAGTSGEQDFRVTADLTLAP